MTPAALAAPDPRTAPAGRHIRGEMREQPDVLGSLARHAVHFADQTGVLSEKAGGFDEVVFLASSCAEYAAALGRYAVETRCGIPARVLTSVEAIGPTLGPGPDDRRRLAVVLAPNGSDPGVLALAANYAGAGATLVAVTNDVRSTLARAAALCVDLAAGLELAASPTKSTTGLMFAVLAIADGLPVRGGVGSKVAETGDGSGLGRTGDGDGCYSEGRYSIGLGDAASAKALALLVAELLGDPSPADVAAARLVPARRIAVIGCDHHLPAALETARMFRDAAGLTAEGFSADGFSSGPVGGFDAETTAVLFTGEADDAVRELRANLLERGVPLVTISTVEPDLGFPMLGTMAECILATVRGQQLAVAAAAARGLDPDRLASAAEPSPEPAGQPPRGAKLKAESDMRASTRPNAKSDVKAALKDEVNPQTDADRHA